MNLPGPRPGRFRRVNTLVRELAAAAPTLDVSGSQTVNRGLHTAVRELLELRRIDGIVYLDSQYRVRNFSMNDKCAAGTGKFMEVIAQILETSIDQVRPLSLQSTAPCDINSTCVVFAQSEVISLVARRFDRRDILAGMHASMARRVVKMIRKNELEGDILMTGGGALNIGLRQAFEDELMRDVFVASHPQFNGAIGAALIACERGR
ncbi:MAG: hypothetical protein II885_17595 [Oscillospiraceae bacterium]|nr:hypothetical protein [Oscillospiraceae bacterium]